MKLELVPLPVTDVDRAKAFYVGLGFAEDVDVSPAPGVRVVQLTPPGSACSISIGTGLPVYTEAPPGSVKGLHLVVRDIEAARAELVGRGVDVGEVQDVGGGVRYAGFADPDGNTLTLQEMSWRTGDAF
jgi:catechol 2,3-dioxygenase-like lactoylglutathione lyase family enzyme